MKQPTVSRRQLLVGTGAAMAASALPSMPAIATSPALASVIPARGPIPASRSMYSVAELSADLEEFLAMYLRCEATYDPTDLALVENWKRSYDFLIRIADRVHYEICPDGPAEIALIARAKSIWPSAKQRARMFRPEITGNSRAFENLKRSWLARQRRYVDAQLAYDALCETSPDEQTYVAGCHRLSEASDKLRIVSRRICAMVPRTQGDRELFRRTKVQWAWREQALSERRRGIVNAGRKKHHYKAGHLIDPDRLSWG
jgi:hypothetical protein